MVAPGEPPPVVVRARLESIAGGLRGRSRSAAGAAERACALDRLRLALTGLPEDVRLRVLELRIEGASSERIVLEAEARSHADARRIATALQEVAQPHGWLVQPPRTQSLPSRGVALTISANAPAHDAPEQSLQ